MMEGLSQDPRYQNESFVSEYFTSTAHIREDVGSSVKLDPASLFAASSRSDRSTSKVTIGASFDKCETPCSSSVKSNKCFDEVEEFTSNV